MATKKIIVDNTPQSEKRNKDSGVFTRIEKLNDLLDIDYPNHYICAKCGTKVTKLENFVSSHSELYAGYNYRIPFCSSCIDKLYLHYVKKIANQKPYDENIERQAIRRICMKFDIYYSESIVTASMKANSKSSLILAYIKNTNLWQYKDKTYDTTLDEEYQKNLDSTVINKIEDIDTFENISEKTIKFFGTGYEASDYIFLQEEYDDWIFRCECKSKTQEILFKNLCFKELDIIKARQVGADTKDLDKSLQDYLATLNLQPRQNSADAISDTQTFGTLLDKWENTRPLPEIDEELRDVDRIGLYIDVFFKGHLAKMMNMKNGLSNLYNKFIGKYTVKRPEYNEDTDSEALFDSLFGNQSIDGDEEGDSSG